MKHIRDLLMDCRIELRTLVRDFHKTELCKRIDDARDALLHGPGAAPPVAAVSVEAADQIAQAWQASAEDLRLTAPAIYDLLTKKVAQRLAALPKPASASKDDAASVEGGSPSGASTESSSVQPKDAVAAAPVSGAVETAPVHSPTLNATLDDGHVPSQTVLTAIAASKRRFTEAQREWCVGEAMVRSGFSIDPEEFIARGDNEMARYILESSDLQS